MTEIEHLMQKAASSLDSAGLLMREGYFDYAVSRSYYAMFYAAEAVLLTEELKFSSHRSVISLFGEHFIKPGIFRLELGRRLSEAFKNRLVGDYSFMPRFDEETAKNVLGWAEEFVGEIGKYLEARR